MEEKIINVKLEAMLESVQISIGTAKSLLTVMNIKRLTADLTMRQKEMVFISALKTVNISDPTPNRKHLQVK